MRKVKPGDRVEIIWTNYFWGESKPPEQSWVKAIVETVYGHKFRALALNNSWRRDILLTSPEWRLVFDGQSEIIALAKGIKLVLDARDRAEANISKIITKATRDRAKADTADAVDALGSICDQLIEKFG